MALACATPGFLAANAGYRNMFAKAFPCEGVSAGTLAKAIASFERSVVSAKAPFDAWIEGDEDAISQEAKHGFELFNGKAGCAKCHSGWNFTDDGFHDIGLKSEDLGRGKFIPVESQKHAFKTPTLRNIDRRAHYMHDGSANSLEEVIDFYNSGGDVQRASVASEIKPLCLSKQEQDSLIAFLKTLPAKTHA